jgi:hypothetical protein
MLLVVFLGLMMIGPSQENDMSIRTLPIPVILLLTSAAWLRADERVVNRTFGFEMRIPAGFIREDSLATGKVIYVFRRPAQGERQETFILVSRLEGTIGREKITPQQASAAKPGMSIYSEQWHGLEVEAFRIANVVGGRPTLRLHAQIPLAGEAIQVGIIGDESAEPELRTLLHQLLTHLEGRSNWLNNAERNDRVLFLAAGGAIVLLVLALGYARRTRERRNSDLVDRTLSASGAVCSVCISPVHKAKANQCSVCGAPQKSSSNTERLVGRSMLYGMACGTVLGGMWGYDFIAKGSAGALGGALVMSIPGMLLGLVAGLFWAGVRWFTRKPDVAAPTWTFNSSSVQRIGLDQPFNSSTNFK